MMFPKGIEILLIVSAVLCSIGFFRFVWFMSVGYGLAVAGIGAALLIMAVVKAQYSLIYLLLCILLAVYGIRLGGFLLIREMKNANYRKKLADVGGETKVPVFVSAVIWLCVAVLYVMECAGPVYLLFNGAADHASVLVYAGTVIAAAGIWLEAEADRQKSAEKKTNPNLPAMNGLYKLCRCPNYFGEMLFWTGVFITGVNVYTGGQWIMALIGYVSIVYIMLAGAKRMETRHIRYYGQIDAYNRYADTTPLIIPFVPWYHVTSPEKIAQEEAKKKAKAEKKKK